MLIGFVPDAQVGWVVLTNIAGVPLRDAVSYEIIDRALDLPESDWNQKYHQFFDPLLAGLAKGKQTAAQERITDAPPTHPLENYAGTYSAEGYPEFAVELASDQLRARTVGSLDWSELKHYHYDVFQWHVVDFDQSLFVRFLTNDNGDIDSISIPIEPAVENVIFKRNALELPVEIISTLLGEYVPPVDGLTFTVSASQGKLYITQSGGTAQEMKPYKLEETAIGFKLDRLRFDFVRENGAITKAILKAPGLTLEAPRKA